MSGTLAIGVDYSQDELDALADAYGVRALGSARLLEPPRVELDAAVLRATLATALRGLVARRAIMLEGTATAPRIAFLEPHATVLAAFVGAQRIVRVDTRTPTRFDRRLVFVRDAVAVEQIALPARAIVRMTAHPAQALERLVLGSPQPVEATADDRRPFELSLRALDQTSEELTARGASAAAIDFAYARRRRIDITDTTFDGHRVTATASTWIDAGTLGWWRVEPDGDPAVVARISPVPAADLVAA
jgi:hypothetical protein